MHLSIHEMCMLSAAGGWIAAWVTAWAFQWLKMDVHDMNAGDLAKLLSEIRNELLKRVPQNEDDNA
jgi:hypothetical protein